MKPIKRIEVIVDQGDQDAVLSAIAAEGVRHYTLIQGVGGMGEHGHRGGDPFGGTFDNTYILIACTQDEAERVVEGVRPILTRMGGVCMVSDANWVVR